MKDCWHGCDKPHNQHDANASRQKNPKQKPVQSVVQNIYIQLCCKFGLSTSKKDAVCDQALWQETYLCRQNYLYSLER